MQTHFLDSGMQPTGGSLCVVGMYGGGCNFPSCTDYILEWQGSWDKEYVRRTGIGLRLARMHLGQMKSFAFIV